MYSTIHIHLGEPDPKKRLEEIKKDAATMGMSVSKLLIYCYELVKPQMAGIAKREAERMASK